MSIATARAWVVASLLLAAGIVCFGAGFRLGEAQADRLRAEHAQARADAAETARLRERAAHLASQRALAALADTLADQARTTEERRRALPAAASADRPCLREPALRVLDGAPGIRVRPGMSEPAARAAAPGAAAAAAAGQPGPAEPPRLSTSEADAAGWILSAGQAHEACRAQVAALIAWHAQAAQTAPMTTTGEH